MSEIDRDLSESSDDENFRFFENLSPSNKEDEKLRGGEVGVGVDLRSEMIDSDPNVFLGQQFSREEMRISLLVILMRGCVSKLWVFRQFNKNIAAYIFNC